ncbi:hypothetical protein [Tenacibaculum todarodis]|nr:hypothetical protein [Tenacibaculum todarodis]
MSANIITKVVVKGLAAVAALAASVRLAKDANADKNKLNKKTE